ncbi:hypothetical protein ACWCOT_39810 [Nonomuraea bangladeshensis]
MLLSGGCLTPCLLRGEVGLGDSSIGLLAGLPELLYGFPSGGAHPLVGAALRDPGTPELSVPGAWVGSMRYGIDVAILGDLAEPAHLVTLAQETEAAGWDAVLAWDHLAFAWDMPSADRWVALAAAAPFLWRRNAVREGVAGSSASGMVSRSGMDTVGSGAVGERRTGAPSRTMADELELATVAACAHGWRWPPGIRRSMAEAATAGRRSAPAMQDGDEACRSVRLRLRLRSSVAWRARAGGWIGAVRDDRAGWSSGRVVLGVLLALVLVGL